MPELYAEFVNNLKKRFGKYDDEHHRFDKMSNSEIARELGYSDAQFSRLINGSATDGEYQRANQNLNRIIYIDKLEHDLSFARSDQTYWQKNKLWVIVTALLTASCLYLLITTLSGDNEPTENKNDQRDATLEWAFETSYIKPYVSLDELPEDCNYPCYKYQGKWELKNKYKLPFFREQNGYHYVATEVKMYARCMSEVSDAGNQFEGYEYQKHEIWYDKRELPIDSFIYDNGQLKKDYEQLDFEQDENFVKVAFVHTFFRNEFKIDSLGIVRKGKVIGRDVEIIPDDELMNNIDASQLSTIKNNINRISRVRLKDFSKPISCDRAEPPSKDFHLVKDGDEMTFDCQLTTSRVALNYAKTYVLSDQYIKNTCRSSVESN